MKTVEVREGLRVPLLTVRDLIQLCDRAYEEERSALLADLEASNADADRRLEELREHSKRKGSTALLLLATYRISIATEMVRTALVRSGVADPEAELNALRPDVLTRTAQALCGYETKESSANPIEPSPSTS
jgi:hypothetical protein